MQCLRDLNQRICILPVRLKGYTRLAEKYKRGKSISDLINIQVFDLAKLIISLVLCS